MLTPAKYVTTPGGYGQEAGVWDRAEIETHLSVQFQNGPVAIHGVNGVSSRDVLQIVVDHERAMQKHDPSRDRAQVITKLDEALLWDRRRAEAENTPEYAARARGQA
jgi:hypothetical protein